MGASETHRIILDKSSASLFITFNNITGFYHKAETTTKTCFNTHNPNCKAVIEFGT